MNATTRFSNRVEDYILYRPGYPAGIINMLTEKIQLSKENIIADIGAGTGFSAELFLNNGNKVFAIEPNDAMRAACTRLYGRNANLAVIKGTAEATTLPNSSVDVIVAGQAFHWFDRNAAKSEFARVLKPGGHIILLWNERLESNAFLKQYEQLLKVYGTDYIAIDHRNIKPANIQDFFAPKNMSFFSLPNEQVFDLKSFLGRIRSSSYAPADGAEHDRLMEAATALFRRFSINDKVTFLYDTKVYYC